MSGWTCNAETLIGAPPSNSSRHNSTSMTMYDSSLAGVETSANGEALEEEGKTLVIAMEDFMIFLDYEHSANASFSAMSIQSKQMYPY